MNSLCNYLSNVYPFDWSKNTVKSEMASWSLLWASL